MQKCDFFMEDLIEFIDKEFMSYIYKKREHQMRKLIQKCYEKKAASGLDSMVNFLKNDNNKQKSKLPWTVKELEVAKQEVLDFIKGNKKQRKKRTVKNKNALLASIEKSNEPPSVPQQNI